MTDVPFYRLPLPPIQRRSHEPLRDVWAPDTVSLTVDENPAPSKSLDNNSLLRANGDAPSHDDTAHMPTESVPEDAAAFRDPLDILKLAANDLDLARNHARECRTTVQNSRVVFSRALEQWNRTLPVQTQEQALRDYVNTSQAERARKAAANQAVSYPGVTRTARAMAGGNARQGGGRAYVRGPAGTKAFSGAEAAKLNAVAAAARQKPTGEGSR
jgi:hypothetical protein